MEPGVAAHDPELVCAEVRARLRAGPSGRHWEAAVLQLRRLANSCDTLEAQAAAHVDELLTMYWQPG